MAQINIDTTKTADHLVNKILRGNGVLIGNVKYTGPKHALGFFQDDSGQLGLEYGIVLTSGNVLYVPGPNKTSRSGWASNALGDEELDKITRGQTYDAAVLEFDFITQSEYLSFEYIFASEEYPEYVGSKFNDVFAFFVEGPGLPRINIARLPDNRTPITVNTVNDKRNKSFFVNNTFINTSDPFLWDVRKRKVVENKNYLQTVSPPEYHTQFDGFTILLKASCEVKPNEVYHIKIAIADVADGILDSGVILNGGSFKSHGTQVVKIKNRFEQQIVPKLAESRKSEINAGQEMTRRIPGEVTIGSIEFEFDEYSIPVNYKHTLDNVVKHWHKNAGSKIYIIGHTDSIGSTAYNLSLSKSRASTVASALKQMGIPDVDLVIFHYGETRPLEDNQTSDGRARNRRVELVVAY